MKLSSIKTYGKRIYVLIFFLIIIIPPISGVFMLPDVSVENRGPNPKPEYLSGDTIGQYESYLVDRIAFRKNMIQMSSMMDYFLFNKSITDKVLIGKRGQLFYTGEDIRQDMKRELVVPQNHLDAIVKVQKDIQEQMDKRGIKYLIVVPPDKHNVYTDDVPDYYKGDPTKPTRKEQVLKALRDNTSVEILDLTEALVNETKIRDTYLQTDSHWNYNGSFIGYQEIINKVKEWFPTIPGLKKEQFNITNTKENNQNLAKMLSLGNILYDKASVRFSPEQPGEAKDAKADYPDPNWYSEAFYMIVTQQDSRQDLPNAVMYRDSFAGLDGWTIGNLNRFLCNSFFRFASYSTHQVDFNYIDAEQADVVIFELLESNIEHLGINYLDNNEIASDKPLYAFDTPLNGKN